MNGATMIIRCGILLLGLLLGALILPGCGKKLSMPDIGIPGFKIGPETCMKFNTWRLAWDQHPNDNGDLDGFKLYRSFDNTVPTTSYSLIHTISADPLATTTFLNELNQPLMSCQTNYVYITAYDLNGLESDPSNIVCWGIGCPSKKSLPNPLGPGLQKNRAPMPPRPEPKSGLRPSPVQMSGGL
jgi:hypothetical protein